MNGTLDCTRGAAPSVDPAALVSACSTTLTGASLNGQLTSIANAGASTRPSDLVTACEALAGASLNGKLDCILGAAPSPDPSRLVTACTSTLTGASLSGQLTCLANGGPSPSPTALVTAYEELRVLCYGTQVLRYLLISADAWTVTTGCTLAHDPTAEGSDWIRYRFEETFSFQGPLALSVAYE